MREEENLKNSNEEQKKEICSIALWTWEDRLLTDKLKTYHLRWANGLGWAFSRFLNQEQSFKTEHFLLTGDTINKLTIYEKLYCTVKYWASRIQVLYFEIKLRIYLLGLASLELRVRSLVPHLEPFFFR